MRNKAMSAKDKKSGLSSPTLLWEQPVVRGMSCVFLPSWYLRGRLLEAPWSLRSPYPEMKRWGHHAS